MLITIFKYYKINFTFHISYELARLFLVTNYRVSTYSVTLFVVSRSSNPVSEKSVTI